MLSRKFKNILFTKATNSNAIYRPLVPTRSFSKWFNIFSDINMTSVRFKLFRDMVFSRVLNAWSRHYVVGSIFRRHRRERGMREMLLVFRQVFLKPRRTHFLVYASAAFKKTEEKPGPPKKCSRNIRDKTMVGLIADLDGVEELSKRTLYCEGCEKRIVIDAQKPGVQYCACPNSTPPLQSYEGWVPYMEDRDVIIWRKEHKPGGLYSYKVYGRYKNIRADDFAMIQVDGAYRRKWDSAVASISIVEREANGVKDQSVLHWEVLWPTLFSNRDYVYLRRHKEFDVQTRCLVHKDGIFGSGCKPTVEKLERSNVHAQAQEVSLEKDRPEEKKREAGDLRDNKVYVIVSRSCTHPDAPETRNAVRVNEYWSHMVITTLNGPDNPGVEFVLTYYDEPSVGGLPTAVTSWAMGRAGPAFLARMKQAAEEYRAWRLKNYMITPDFTPFEPSKISYEGQEGDISEENMETSKHDPDLESSEQNEGANKTSPITVVTLDSVVKKDDEDDDEDEDKDDVHEANPCDDDKESKTTSPPASEESVKEISPPASEESVKEISPPASEESVKEITESALPDKVFLVEMKKTPEENIPCSPVPEQDAINASADKDSLEENPQEEKKGGWWWYLYPLHYFV